MGMLDINEHDMKLFQNGKMRLIGLELKMQDHLNPNFARELKMVDLDSLIVPLHAAVGRPMGAYHMYDGQLIFPITIHTNLGDINGNL